MNSNSIIRYTFPRKHVLNLNVTCFVEAFDISTMPEVALGTYCDSLELEIETAQNDDRQPYLIPEVRSFCHELDRVWPYTAFCCELKSPFMLIHTLCQLTYVSVLDRDNAHTVCVYYDGPELAAAITRGSDQIRRLGRQARMSRAQIVRRETAFADYLFRHLGRS